METYQMSGAGVCSVTTSGLPLKHVPPQKIVIVLPSSPWLADSKTNIPLGSLYIASILREQGHDVHVVSMLNVKKEGDIRIPDELMDARVFMFGFCSPQFNECLALAAYIKDRNPEALLVAGGPHPSYEPQETYNAVRQDEYHVRGRLSSRRDYTQGRDQRRLFDSVVVMEGERQILNLLSDWDQGALQPFYYGDKGELPNLDEIPYPAWDMLPFDHIYNDGIAVMKKPYVESSKFPGKYPVMSMIGTRGCPYRCTYCSTPWIGQAPRYRSPQNIIGEIKKALDLGIGQVKFQDDTYTLHKTKLRELAEAIHAELGPGSFASRIHTRVNTLNDHIAESLKMMNCKVTCFGIESGSQKVLDANQKGTKVKQNTDAIIKAKEHGFYTVAFLVAGLAGETLETMQETMDWLDTVKPYLDSCNLAVGIPYPGSRFWTHPDESGIEIFDYNYDNQWIVGFSARDEIIVRPHGVTVEEMFRVKKDMFDFLVDRGWAKAEWDDDVRIKNTQQLYSGAAANHPFQLRSG